MHLRPLQQLLLAVLALTLAALLLLTAWWLRPAAVSSADLLPSRYTEVWLQHISRSSARLLERDLPALTTIPLTERDSDLAFLRLRGGNTGWILFERTSDVPSLQTLSITASDPSVQALLQSGSTLRTLSDFSRLIEAAPVDGTLHAFVRFPNPATTVASPILHLFQADRPVLLSVHGSGITLLMAATSAFAPPLTMTPTTATGTVASLHSGNCKASLATWSSHLNQDASIVLESLLRAWGERTFGLSFSVRYDLLPLLDGQCSLQLSTAADGTLSFTLQTTPEKDADVAHRLETLLQQFRGRLSSTSVVERHFEKDFVWRDVRVDTNAVEETSDTVSGFDRTLLRHRTTGASLLLARKGRTAIVSNNPATFDAFTKQPPLPTTTLDPAHASGSMESQALSHFLSTTLPTLWPPRGDLPLGLSGRLTWEMRRKGDVLQLSITQE